MEPCEPIGILDSDEIPLRTLSLPVWDKGLVNGVIVSEQLRTFANKIFLLEQHYQRWVDGLALLNLSPPCALSTLARRLGSLVTANSAFVRPGNEQGICFFATPGDHQPFSWSQSSSEKGNELVPIPSSQPESVDRVRFIAHTYPLNETRWISSYRDGVVLTSSSVQDVPVSCWPNSVKIRSRLHYYLAQNESHNTRPGSYPLLQDQRGFLSDSSIGSVVGYQETRGIIVRPRKTRYNSISVEYLLRIAEQLAIPVVESEMSIREIVEFDELFLVSTPWCLFPVSQVDEVKIGRPHIAPSARFPVFHRLMDAWARSVSMASLVPGQ